MKILIGLFISLISLSSFAGDDPKVSLETLKSILQKSGEAKTDGQEKLGDKNVPAIFFGTKKINGNFTAVDEVKKKHGGTATVFVKEGEEYYRITTNVLKDDGTRAIGTTLAHNKAYEAVQKGETFCGEVEILGSPYNTCYEPIKSADKKTIGIYYVGFKK